MKNKTVMLFGATGFIGHYLIQALLLESDWQIKVVMRQDALDANRLIKSERVHYVRVNLLNRHELIPILQHSAVVINLIGILNGPHVMPYSAEFNRAHVLTPMRIAKAAIQAGVQHFIQISAIGADINAPSMYLRSKGMGERILTELLNRSTVKLTIFRPSLVFGKGDHALSSFKSLIKCLPIIPLSMSRACFQPIYVKNLASVFVLSLNQPNTFGRVFELGGPKVYTLYEIFKTISRAISHKIWIIRLPQFLSYFLAYCLERTSKKQPLLTRDNLDSMQVDSVMKGDWPKEFNIQRHSMEDYLFNSDQK